MGVITEASELFEHFRFKSQEETELMLKDLKKRDKIGAELSDILYFVLRFVQRYGFAISEAFDRKMAENAMKYLVGKSKGLNKRYTEFK